MTKPKLFPSLCKQISIVLDITPEVLSGALRGRRYTGHVWETGRKRCKSDGFSSNVLLKLPKRSTTNNWTCNLKRSKSSKTLVHLKMYHSNSHLSLMSARNRVRSSRHAVQCCFSSTALCIDPPLCLQLYYWNENEFAFSHGNTFIFGWFCMSWFIFRSNFQMKHPIYIWKVSVWRSFPLIWLQSWCASCTDTVLQ